MKNEATEKFVSDLKIMRWQTNSEVFDKMSGMATSIWQRAAEANKKDHGLMWGKIWAEKLITASKLLKNHNR